MFCIESNEQRYTEMLKKGDIKINYPYRSFYYFIIKQWGYNKEFITFGLISDDENDIGENNVKFRIKGRRKWKTMEGNKEKDLEDLRRYTDESYQNMNFGALNYLGGFYINPGGRLTIYVNGVGNVEFTRRLLKWRLELGLGNI